MIDRRLINNFGWALFFLTFAFLIIGLVNLYSASFQTGLIAFKRQILWVGFGLIGMISISFFDSKLIKRYTLHSYIFTILLLIVVLIFGREISGSKSWISLGQYLNFQPSEFVKLTVILALAKFYDNDFDHGPYGLSDLLKPLLLASIPITLVTIQPDLGTAFMIFF